MTLTTGGNVGIGTTTPAAILNTSITSGASTTHFLMSETGTTSNSEILIRANNSTQNWSMGAIGFLREGGADSFALRFFTGIGSTNTERMRIDSAGNVGIGTSTPSSFDSFANRLVVGTGSGSQGITIFGGTTGAGTLSFADGTSGTASYQGYIFYNHNTNIMGLYADYDANPAARMAISNTGIQTLKTISVGNATPASTGAGITFPATQSASSDANTLDDYEEGTFTATMTTETSGTITLKTNGDLMTYTKVGRLVTITGMLWVDSVSSPVGTYVEIPLPFTPANIGEYSCRGTGSVFRVSGGTKTVLPASWAEAYAKLAIFINASTVAGNDEFVIVCTYVAV
jgi:hypothetical protein